MAQNCGVRDILNLLQDPIWLPLKLKQCLMKDSINGVLVVKKYGPHWRMNPIGVLWWRELILNHSDIRA